MAAIFLVLAAASTLTGNIFSWTPTTGQATGSPYTITFTATSSGIPGPLEYKFVAQYHDRMPVLLAKEELGNWLSGAYGLERLVPAPNDWLKAVPVSRAVNSSKAPDSPDLIKEIAL